MFSDSRIVQLKDFRGAYLRRDAADVPPEGALLALNCEFNPGQVSTRKGFTEVWNPNQIVTGMFNWVREYVPLWTTGSYLIYYTPTTKKVRYVRDLTSPSAADLFSVPPRTVGNVEGYGISCAGNGSRLIVAVFGADGYGVIGAQVVTLGVTNDIIPVPTLNADTAFSKPMTTAPTLTESATDGNVTAGDHRIGYVFLTRSGFVGKVCPVSTVGLQFDPASVITASGGKQIDFSLNATWPNEATKIYPVMTSTTNLNRYFIVPAYASGITVTGGATSTITATIDISDDDLIAQGSEVTDNLNLLTCDTSGHPPFTPFVVCEYGFRTVYLTTSGENDQAYISEPSKPQHLTADQHVIYLPGFRVMRTAAAMRGVLYIFGPNWTYSVQDSGDVPVLWPSPQLVDGSIGTSSPTGVAVNASGGFLWVAHTSGLYCFNGAYLPLPVSYESDTDWKRINWSYAYKVQVIDDAAKKRVIVLAPLDSATAPSHMLVFDYTDGVDSSRIKYTLWNLTDYAPGAACMVDNPTSQRVELWLGKSTAGKVLRQMNENDAEPYSDDGAAIDWQYETELMPGVLRAPVGTLYQHQGCQIRTKGAGSLSVTARTLDGSRTFAWAPIVLGEDPGQMHLRRLDLRGEAVSHRFTLNAANEYCVLSALKHFYTDWTAFR